MNRKFAIGLAAVIATMSVIPAAANATGTVPPTTTATVPTECMFTPDFAGPARATHAPERTAEISVPDCDTIDGICVILAVTGPSRTVHGISTILPSDPCEGVDDACVIMTLFPDNGPSRVAHSPSVEVILLGWLVELPQPCQDVLSAVAIPTTGGDSGSTLWLASGFLLAGAVLLFGVRRAAAR